MKVRYCVFLALCLFIVQSATSQDVNGNWYGVGVVNKDGTYSSYLSEVILEQKGSVVSGDFNYFFKNAYISIPVKGTFNKKTRILRLHFFPLLNYKAKNANGADCTMTGSFTLMVSKVGASLTGAFQAEETYKYTCPQITLKLKKSTGEMLPEDEPVAEAPKLVFEPVKPVAPVIDSAVQMLNSRRKDVIDIIEVDSDTLHVTLYDNSEYDHDSVSVFYNNKLIVSRKELSSQGIRFDLSVDSSVSEMSMFAENLGELPPNTALMVFMDGQRRFEINLASDFIKSSTLRFKRKPQTPKVTQ